jgi:ABC-type proline/glycine betaine transport system permease subunit
MTTATADRAAGTAGVEPVASAFRAAGDLAGDVGRLGASWLALARAEMALARLSATRLMMGVALLVVLGFSGWLFACLGLGYWLTTAFQRADLAFATVAGLNMVLAGVLVWRMQRWWHAMQMPDSRAALGEIARSLS